MVIAHQVADLDEFEVINERPVFNESRQPVLAQEDESEAPEDGSVAIKGAPDVRLTGVIITPGMRIASLTPANTELENVMAYEGQALTGEFVGWAVSAIQPRSVTLESRDGDKLELDLQVHDVSIKEPPKPVPVAETKTDSQQAEVPVDEEGQPLSRADQIRQRIAERREELRREQEEQQLEGSDNKPERKNNYQSAIRAMLNKKKDNSGGDENDS